MSSKRQKAETNKSMMTTGAQGKEPKVLAVPLSFMQQWAAIKQYGDRIKPDKTRYNHENLPSKIVNCLDKRGPYLGHGVQPAKLASTVLLLVVD